LDKSATVGATTIASENKLQDLTLNEVVDPLASLAAASAASSGLFLFCNERSRHTFDS